MCSKIIRIIFRFNITYEPSICFFVIHDSCSSFTYIFISIFLFQSHTIFNFFNSLIIKMHVMLFHIFQQINLFYCRNF
uniref:Uncharacterized protein n=1 Tax=Staphylococcus aureus TaxID=1280 RepID=Q93IC3_STAAU|nr:hypothetical protein [Staphylococcus aureus]